MLDDLYLPDGKRVNVQLWGVPGSGKTFFLEHTLKKFLRKNQDEHLRVVYISPKHETILDKEPIVDSSKLEKFLRKNRMAVVFPHTDYLEEEVDEIINLLFDIKTANEKFKAVIIIDDSQIMLSSRKEASKAHRRLSLTGRSRKIRGIYVAHGIILNKALEGQTSFLVGFTNPLPLNYRASIERFGFNPEPFHAPMSEREYSFVWFNCRTRQARLMAPIEP